MSRFRRTDDGSIAVLAAVTVPVVLLCVGLAVATIVWSASEHETQRAADTAAVRAAATAFLGTDFPYAAMPGVTTPLNYPDVNAIAGVAGVTPPAPLPPCGTVSVPPVSQSFPGGGVDAGGASLNVPAGCLGVGPFAPPVALGAADSSRAAACQAAHDAMAPDAASYANKFYEGPNASQPACDDGTKRIGVKLATGSPLLGFGETATDAASGALATELPGGAVTVDQALAAFGIHLDSSLPSLICPEVSVTIDQPVREPLFDRSTAPNGRATARRIVKNAVIVPVYEGKVIQAATSGAVSAAAFGKGVTMTTATGTTVTIPPQNLNALLIAAQKQLLTLLDEVDAIADAAIRAAGVTLTELNGTYSGIDPDAPQPPPAPGLGPLQGLRATKCLRDTLTQIYDPPRGDAPTTEEVLENAATSGEEVIAVQVGAVRTACTAPGAVEGIPTANPSDGCIRAATTPSYDPTTGLWEVPFFDATPVLVQDVGDHNFEAVPVHASQASGAFRAGLVRDANDERYDPDVRQPVPTPRCLQTLPPSADTVCQLLSPTPLPTVTLPPVPTVSPPPVPLPTSPSPSPSPSPSSTPADTPTPTPTPTPSSTCLLLCPVTP